MKRIVVILSLIIFITGCNIQNFDTGSIDQIIDKALSDNVHIANVDGKGYKFYLPKGMKIENQIDYNTEMTYKNDTYYLYIDVISYYYKKDNTLKADTNAFYSKVIEYNNKKGKISITEEEKGYKIVVEYNYAKIEAKIAKDNLEEAVLNSIYVLSTIQFNDEVLNTLIEENVLDYQEEQLDIFESKREDGNFLDYIEEYGKYDDSKDSNTNLDEDILSAATSSF